MATFNGRVDSLTANNPSMNLTGETAFTITFVPRDGTGDIILEYDNGNVDPDTQVEIDGVNYDFTFELSATLPTSGQGTNQIPNEFLGATVYIITIQDYPTVGEQTRFAFLPEEEATLAQMDAFGNGAVSLQNIDTTTPGTVCFAEGTRLRTPDGNRAVEHLKAGDRVLTQNGDALEIVWISNSKHRWPGECEDALPILISKGALGRDKPSRDLVVSPLHKVLIAGSDAELFCGQSEVLVPAKGLTALRGIRRMNGKRQITYYHVLLERHAVLLSEGLGSESFYPGPSAMRMLSISQRLAIHRALPGLRDKGYGPAARNCLTPRETEDLAREIKTRLAAARI